MFVPKVQNGQFPEKRVQPCFEVVRLKNHLEPANGTVKLLILSLKCGHQRRISHSSIAIFYWVIHKKVFHKSEEKLHEKMKMTKQKDENLAHE